MHAQTKAQHHLTAVHPMGHPTSFTTSGGLMEPIGTIRGRSCLAAAPPRKRPIESNPEPKTCRSFIRAPKTGEEDGLIQEELVFRLEMTPRQAAKVVKTANTTNPGTTLKLHNLRGWIKVLVSFGLSIADISGGLRRSPVLIAYSASGRENTNAESIQVLTAHGLSDNQILSVLRKYPSVLVNLTPSSLNAKMHRLKELGIPPSEEKGLFEREPYILGSSLKWDTVHWLEGEGYAPEVARGMIKGFPLLLNLTPETHLSKTLDYFTWLVGSSEDARSILAKYPCLFGYRKSAVHAKLAFMVDKLNIDVVTMMKQNYTCVGYSMDTRTGPRTLLLRSLGGAESFDVYSQIWLIMTDEAFVQRSSFCALWEGRPRDVFEGAADLEEGLELCKEQWVREEKPGWEKMKGEFQEQWEESGVEGLPQLRP
eukprot:gene24691-biopygen19137